MKICVIVKDMNDFGGLEDFAKNLAVCVQRQGHQVHFFSTFWVKPENQYLRELRKNNVQFLQLPRWISLLTADWDTKLKLVTASMFICTPFIYLGGLLHFMMKRRSLSQSINSTRNWLSELFISRVYGPDRRKPFVLAVLNWMRATWKPDLIHIQGYTNSLLYIIDWSHEKKIPVVYEEHQTPDAQFNWWKDFRESINKASVVVAVSEKSAEALYKICGVTRPIKVAYVMVPDPLENGWQPSPMLGQPGQPIRITTSARLYVTKGLNYLLDAIVLVRAKHPEAQFRIYGDGEMRDELFEYAEKLGLNKKEIFPGMFTSREELSNIMAQTDIFAMSSILEGLPIALLEAMSYGCPVVGTTVGGIPEVIQDGVNGLLCPPRDAQKLAEKICTLIENPDLRKQFGREARKTYEQGLHHPNKVSEEYISIYQEALANSVK